MKSKEDTVEFNKIKRLLLSSLFGKKVRMLVLTEEKPHTALFLAMEPDKVAVTRPGTDEFIHLVHYKTIQPIPCIQQYVDLTKLAGDTYLINIGLLTTLLSSVKFDKKLLMEKLEYNKEKNHYFYTSIKKVKKKPTVVKEPIVTGVSNATFSMVEDTVSTVLNWVERAPHRVTKNLDKANLKAKILFVDFKEELGFRVPVTPGTTIMSYTYLGKIKEQTFCTKAGVDGPIARVIHEYEDNDVVIKSTYPADIKYVRRK